MKIPQIIRPILAAALLLMSLGAGAAETPLSIVSSACVAIPPSRSVTISTARIIEPGQSIVLGVAIDSADAPDLVVTGPTGVTWRALGGHKSEVRGRTVLLLQGLASQSRLAGSPIDLDFGLVGSGHSVCVRGMRYESFITGPQALSTDGQAANVAAVAPTVAGKQAVDGGTMAIAAFIFEANPNALILSPGAVSDGGACNAALDLCLRMAHQGDVLGTATIGMTPTDASDWQATLAVMATPGLFKDGFE